jgi:2,3-bisphosphoglycerate-independent phosphoglycerate mutase
MERAEPVLAGHPVNAARIEHEQSPATAIWLWGQGGAPSMATYQERFGLTGAVVSAVDLIKGIGVCAGLDVIDVPGATGYLDTDYEGKVGAALDALERHDFVYLHVEAPDEASHEGNIDLKIRAIEDFDRHVVAPILAYARDHHELRLLVAPDHITAISTKTHASDPVPFALCGAGVEPDSSNTYNEREAEQTGLLIAEGHRLVPLMLCEERIDKSCLARAAGR